MTTSTSSPRRADSGNASWTELADALDHFADRVVMRPLRSARSAIEDHYLVDEAFRLLGPLVHHPDKARDTHDWFNIVALIPVVLLNLLGCWHHDVLALATWRSILADPRALAAYWHGRYWTAFAAATLVYFAADSAWIWAVPQCVRSPKTVLGHHIATMAYLCVPLVLPEYAWCMGACMAVELNTWFLIARRAFNRQGHSPWFSVDLNLPLAESIRIKLISVAFYASWFAIRIVLYPYLWVVFYVCYMDRAKVHGPLNILLVCLPLHAVFLGLNIKWTVDLARSKLKRRKLGAKLDKGL